MSEYLHRRGRKLLGEVIDIIESEWDYCSYLEDLKKIRQELFGGEE